MRRLIVVSFVLFAWVVSAAAQSKTDFSGRWTTDPDPAATAAAPAAGGQPGPARGAGPGGRGGAPGRGGRAGDMGSGWGPTITIRQDASQLIVEYMFFARGDMQPPLRFVYALDGSETKNTVMMGHGIQQQTAKATWDAAKLVITTLHTFPDPSTGKPATMDVKQTLSLESPTSLVVETARPGVLGGPSSTTRTVYRKIVQ